MEKAMPFTFDPNDYSGLLKIMDEHGDSETPFFSHNTDMEDLTISVSKERIDVTTYQDNGWVRRNVYWRGGTVEELYEGRWK